MRTQRFDEGVMETLSSDPGLQELYLEPESLGAGGEARVVIELICHAVLRITGPTLCTAC